MVGGSPEQWLDLLDSMVPRVVAIVRDTWQNMPALVPDHGEDDITKELTRLLRSNQEVRQLPFQIQFQQFEIDPEPGETDGRLDIAFNLLVPREDIYFCLEAKLLNVPDANGGVRSCASEYVTKGMMRFVTGRYSRAVRHGGMIGYVRDGDVIGAMANVESNIQRHHKALLMTPPGAFATSTVLPTSSTARETHHHRTATPPPFTIHHLFVT